MRETREKRAGARFSHVCAISLPLPRYSTRNGAWRIASSHASLPSLPPQPSAPHRPPLPSHIAIYDGTRNEQGATATELRPRGSARPSPRQEMRTTGVSFGAPLSFRLGSIFRQCCGKLATLGCKPILLMSAIGLVLDGPFQHAVIHQNSQHESLKLRSVTTADHVQQLFR